MSEASKLDLSRIPLAVVGHILDDSDSDLRTLELAQRYFERRVGQRGATEEDVCQTLMWLAGARVQLLNSKGAMHTLAHLRARSRGRFRDIENWASLLEILLHTEMREWRQAHSRSEILRVDSPDQRTLARLNAVKLQLRGRIFSAQGQIKLALAEFEKGLAALRVGPAQTEDLAITAEIYNDQGQAYHRESLLDEANGAYTTAETVASHITFPLATARSLRGRGLVELSRKKYQDAVSYLKSSLDICQRHDTPYGILRSSISLGRAYYAQADLREALYYFEEARLQCGKGRYPVEEAEVSARIGDVLLSEGQYQKAAEFYEADLQLTGANGDERSRANALRNVGRIQRLLGNFSRSETCLQESAMLFNKLGDRLGLCQTLQQMVQCYLEQGKTTDARQSLNLMRDSAEKANNPHEIGVARMLEGIVLRHEGRAREALNTLERSMGVLSREPGFFMLMCQLEMAQAYLDLGENNLAVENLKASIASARQFKHHDMEKKALDLLAKLDRSEWVRVASSASTSNAEVANIERRVLSLFALELRHTNWLYEQNPERVVALLEGFYSVVDQVAQKYRGVILRIVGHRILMVFGLEDTAEPIRVLRAAEASLQSFIRLQQENHYYQNLGLTGAVATGHAVCAMAGSTDKKELSVFGEPLDRAGQLVASAGADELWLCPDTFRALPSEDTKSAVPREVSAGAGIEKFVAYAVVHSRGGASGTSSSSRVITKPRLT